MPAFFIALQPHTTGYFYTLAIDPAGILGTEEGHYPTYIFSHAYTAQCGEGGHLFIQFLIVSYTASVKICCNGAGGNHIRFYFSCTQFCRQVAGKDFHCAFERAIGGSTGEGYPCQSGGDIDNATSIIQERQGFLGEEINPFEMHVHQFVEQGFAGFGDQCVATHTSVVDEEVETVCLECLLQYLFELFQKSVKAFNIAYAELQGGCFLSGLLDLSYYFFCVFFAGLVGKDHVDTFFCQAEGHIPA